MNAAEDLQNIAQQVTHCDQCALHRTRKKSVPGAGPHDAEIMFVGEGPGFNENEQGLPFVGAAGKFLDELLAKIQLRREQVFITNVVKCRPPNNRDPEPVELQACADYLDRQIAAINPRLIVTLGRFSMARFLPNVKISQVHGQARWIEGRLIVAMFHPAAALHQAALKPVMEQDFLRLPHYIEEARQRSAPPPAPVRSRLPEEPAGDKPQPKQLNLFELF